MSSLLPYADVCELDEIDLHMKLSSFVNDIKKQNEFYKTEIAVLTAQISKMKEKYPNITDQDIDKQDTVYQSYCKLCDNLKTVQTKIVPFVDFTSIVKSEDIQNSFLDYDKYENVLSELRTWSSGDKSFVASYYNLMEIVIEESVRFEITHFSHQFVFCLSID